MQDGFSPVAVAHPHGAVLPGVGAQPIHGAAGQTLIAAENPG